MRFYFACRQLVNLAVDEISASLTGLLCMTPKVISELASGAEVGGVKLVPYQGAPGRRRFVSEVKSDGLRLQFVCNAKGLGLLSRGAGYYSPTAVSCLLRWLATRRANDGGFLRRLERAAVMCGGSHVSGRLRLGADLPLAVSIAQASAEEPWGG